MPYDPLVLHACVHELKPQLIGARINKIHQPDELTVILRYHGQEGGGKLLLCAHPNNGRLHATGGSKENPAKAPLFVMVLRKWLEGSRITDISAVPGERVAQLELDATNDLGDHVPLRLIIEIMGKHSNIILVDAQGMILDGIRRYGSHLSRYREVLPGKKYLPPPPLDKLPFLPKNEEELAAAVYANAEHSLAKTLGNRLKGVSPVLARNIPLLAGLEPDLPGGDMGQYEISRVYQQLRKLQELPEQGGQPTLLYEHGAMRDYYLFPLPEWQGQKTVAYPAMNEAVDAYYIEQERLQALEKARNALARSLRQNQARLQKKIGLEEADLANCEAADAYRQAGDLLAANLYFLRKGSDSVELPAFDDPERLITVKLDPAKTPQENIQYYYKRYSKSKNARQRIEEQLLANQAELDYLFSIQQSLTDCDDISELELIAREAAAAGFCKHHPPGVKNKAEGSPLPPRQYLSADGFVILIGRNNKQNDRLTLKQARPEDIWLHTQKIPGSHVIIVTGGQTVPESTILEAAAYAAWFSKARESGKTAVDYTPVAYVKKPNAAVPGYVTYTRQNTVYVEPKAPSEP